MDFGGFVVVVDVVVVVVVALGWRGQFFCPDKIVSRWCRIFNVRMPVSRTSIFVVNVVVWCVLFVLARARARV